MFCTEAGVNFDINRNEAGILDILDKDTGPVIKQYPVVWENDSELKQSGQLSKKQRQVKRNGLLLKS
jgi:hypothetical protein